MMLKRFSRLAMSVSTMVLAAGWTVADASAKTPEKIEQIGLMVQDMSNPFFSAMDKGAKKAAEAIGAKLNTQDAQLDLANQNTQIDAFIQQGVDLIFFLRLGVACSGGQQVQIVIAEHRGGPFTERHDKPQYVQ